MFLRCRVLMLEERFLMRVHRCSGTARSIASECKRAAPARSPSWIACGTPAERKKSKSKSIKVREGERYLVVRCDKERDLVRGCDPSNKWEIVRGRSSEGASMPRCVWWEKAWPRRRQRRDEGSRTKGDWGLVTFCCELWHSVIELGLSVGYNNEYLSKSGSWVET